MSDDGSDPPDQESGIPDRVVLFEERHPEDELMLTSHWPLGGPRPGRPDLPPPGPDAEFYQDRQQHFLAIRAAASTEPEVPTPAPTEPEVPAVSVTSGLTDDEMAEALTAEIDRIDATAASVVPAAQEYWEPGDFPVDPSENDWALLATYWTENPRAPPPGWVPATTAGYPRPTPVETQPAPEGRPTGPIRTEREHSARVEPYPTARSATPGGAARRPARQTHSTGNFEESFYCFVPGCDRHFKHKRSLQGHIRRDHPAYRSDPQYHTVAKR